MRTIVYPPTSGIGRTRTVGAIAHFMTDADADAIVDQLAAQGIPVAISHGPGYRVNLKPTGPVTVRQEAQAIQIVRDVTDAPPVWRGERRPVAPTCLLCGTGGELTHELCGRCARVVGGAVA